MPLALAEMPLKWFIVICRKGERERVKISGSFSTWKEANKGVQQGSVLGPLVFNIAF